MFSYDLNYKLGKDVVTSTKHIEYVFYPDDSYIDKAIPFDEINANLAKKIALKSGSEYKIQDLIKNTGSKNPTLYQIDFLGGNRVAVMNDPRFATLSALIQKVNLR